MNRGGDKGIRLSDDLALPDRVADLDLALARGADVLAEWNDDPLGNLCRDQWL